MAARQKLKLSELWKQVDFTNYSTITLIFSNILVIIFAVVDKLSALDVMWIYWSQSVIIGIFNFIKIISLKEFSTEGFRQGNKPVLPTKATKISTGLFFLFHYGFFHLIYSFFLGTFNVITRVSNGSLETNYFLISMAVFFISYLIEFINSKKEQRDELPNIGKIMFAPYIRIIPMHFTIIFGGFIAAAGSFFSTDTNLFVLVLFLGLKSFVDLISHAVDFNKLEKQNSTISG
jgi:hypothetical protein